MARTVSLTRPNGRKAPLNLSIVARELLRRGFGSALAERTLAAIVERADRANATDLSWEQFRDFVGSAAMDPTQRDDAPKSETPGQIFTTEELPDGSGQLTVLVIANSDYDPAGLNLPGDLPGCLIDLQRWRDLLPGLAEAQRYACVSTAYVVDADAATMRSAIASLLEPKLKPCAGQESSRRGELSEGTFIRDTRALIYSGHGGGVSDVDGDEPTGIDAALLGIDARVDRPDPNVQHLIRAEGAVIDDYVSGLAGAVTQLASLYFFYDCCYNGGASRVFDPRPPQFRPRVRTLTAFPTRGRQAGDFGPDRRPSGVGRGTWLEASLWNETAKEVRGVGGAYTDAVATLLASDPYATPQAMTAAALAATAHFKDTPDGPQTPQLEDLEGLAGKAFLEGKQWI